MKVVVVGAGLSGCVVAERMASEGNEVLVLDERSHIAGNCYDEIDRHGVMIHRYGPHVFHTNAKKVVEYLSHFTTWRRYEHRVLSSVRGMLVPIPINLTTLRRLQNNPVLREEEAVAYFKSVRTNQGQVTSEDVVLNLVGHELCDDFYRGYTLKQWGRDLSQLAPSVAARIPVRTNCDDRYFTDQFQAIPMDGYTAMCRNMLDHPKITVELNTRFTRDSIPCDLLLYTGTIDSYYGFRFGQLPYRSLRFEFEHFPREWYQSVGSVNFPNSEPYTRITEFKHITGQKHSGTTIAREYPSEEGDPYYPVPSKESSAVLAMYQDLALNEPNVVFLGRLGTYRYLNMDQAVAAAYHTAERVLGRKRYQYAAT